MLNLFSLSLRYVGVSVMIVGVTACTGVPKKTIGKAGSAIVKLEAIGDRREVVLYALGLLGVNYQFGGVNPEAGVDCSGMVSFIYKNALGVNLPRSAAQIAKVSKPVSRHEIQAGDFVFFNTMNRPYSHIGIYLGDNKFIHAPRSKSRVAVANLDSPYYAACFQSAATIFR